jgi:hypothetical protein
MIERSPLSGNHMPYMENAKEPLSRTLRAIRRAWWTVNLAADDFTNTSYHDHDGVGFSSVFSVMAKFTSWQRIPIQVDTL